MANETTSPGVRRPERHASAALVGPRPAVAARRARPAAPTLSRRSFLVWVAALPFGWAAASMLGRLRSRHQPAPVVLPADLVTGLSITGELVVARSATGAVRAFAARCTHLGCRLERIENGQVVCPCHGSRFFADGRVAAGPAARPLVEWRVVPDAQTGGWTVHAG